MKRLLSIFLILFSLPLVFYFIGCAINVPIPPEQDYCYGIKPGDSWLCDQSAKMGITLNKAYDWLYTGAAVAVLSDQVDIKTLCDFDKEVADHYVKYYPISYDTAIDIVFEKANFIQDPNKRQLIKGIINKNLVSFRSPEIIKVEDDRLIRGGNNMLKKDLGCE